MPDNIPAQNESADPAGDMPPMADQNQLDPQDGFIAALLVFSFIACLITLFLIAWELHYFYDFTFGGLWA